MCEFPIPTLVRREWESLLSGLCSLNSGPFSRRCLRHKQWISCKTIKRTDIWLLSNWYLKTRCQRGGGRSFKRFGSWPLGWEDSDLVNLYCYSVIVIVLLFQVPGFPESMLHFSSTFHALSCELCSHSNLLYWLPSRIRHSQYVYFMSCVYNLYFLPLCTCHTDKSA